MTVKFISLDLQYVGWVRGLGESVLTGWSKGRRMTNVSMTDASIIRLRIALAIASHNYGLPLRISYGLDYLIRGLSIDDMVRAMVRGFEHSKKVSDDEYLSQAFEEAKLIVGGKEEKEKSGGED